MYVEFVVPRGTEILGLCIDRCVEAIIGRWGGCTVGEGLGYWRNPDTGLLDTEPVATMGVDTGSESQAGVQDWFDALANYARTLGDQHTVYYRMTGCVSRFIGPDAITRPVLHVRA